MLELRSMTKQCLEKHQVACQISDADSTLDYYYNDSTEMAPFHYILYLHLLPKAKYKKSE